MHRVTAARLLLLLFGISACAPVLQAFSAAPPHACCLRKLHRPAEHQTRLDDSSKHDGSCCPPLTARHSAQIQADKTSVRFPQSAELVLSADRISRVEGFETHNCSRAPPIVSFLM
jgi:hypothetical protein